MAVATARKSSAASKLNPEPSALFCPTGGWEGCHGPVEVVAEKVLKHFHIGRNTRTFPVGTKVLQAPAVNGWGTIVYLMYGGDEYMTRLDGEGPLVSEYVKAGKLIKPLNMYYTHDRVYIQIAKGQPVKVYFCQTHDWKNGKQVKEPVKECRYILVHEESGATTWTNSLQELNDKGIKLSVEQARRLSKMPEQPPIR